MEIKEEYQDENSGLDFESEHETSRNLFHEQDFVDTNEYLKNDDGDGSGNEEEDEGDIEEVIEETSTVYAPAENLEFVDDSQRKNMKTFNFLKYLIAQRQKSVRALQEKVREQHATLTKMKGAK